MLDRGKLKFIVSVCKERRFPNVITWCFDDTHFLCAKPMCGTYLNERIGTIQKYPVLKTVHIYCIECCKVPMGISQGGGEVIKSSPESRHNLFVSLVYLCPVDSISVIQPLIVAFSSIGTNSVVNTHVVKSGYVIFTSFLLYL